MADGLKWREDVNAGHLDLVGSFKSEVKLFKCLKSDLIDFLKSKGVDIVGTTRTVLVRNWDCKHFEEIPLSVYRDKEALSGTVSAFAETWDVVNGIVANGCTVEQFLKYRNS